MDKCHGKSVEILDKFREECGLFGIVSSEEDAAHLTFLGLHSLQHRGQESTGIAVDREGSMSIHKDMGLVTEVFTDELLDELRGGKALGHVRYSTTGSSLIVNAQPLVIRSYRGSMALAHNGNLVNSHELRRKLEAEGSIFHSSLDTEVVAHLLARSGHDNLEEALLASIKHIKGAYSILILANGRLYGLRDPHGFRPLILGQVHGDYALASESCAFHLAGGHAVREIEPGEMVVLEEGSIRSEQFAQPEKKRFCIFEYIYFARPDSTFGSRNVHLIRRNMGRQLAREFPVEGDIVIPVPDSGISAAQGYADELSLPFEFGLIKNKYVGRTFILPRQSLRDLKVKLKLSPVRELIQGKRVILIDDSIVRGTTSRLIVNMVRESGAREVHLGVSSPPVINSCYYGLDTTKRQELIASQRDVEGVAQHIGADSLSYLSLKGLHQVFENEDSYCDACFSGSYPVIGMVGKDILEEGY